MYVSVPYASVLSVETLSEGLIRMTHNFGIESLAHDIARCIWPFWVEDLTRGAFLSRVKEVDMYSLRRTTGSAIPDVRPIELAKAKAPHLPNKILIIQPDLAVRYP